MTGSRSSYSPRMVLQPSTTRKTAARPSGAAPSRSRSASSVATSPTVRRTAAGSCRPATPPTWGSSRSPASPPPPKSRQYTWTRAGVWVSDSPHRTVRSRVDLPLCGPPTTATCPVPPDRVSHSRSRRCSYGLSTSATGTCNAPRSCGLATVSPSAGSVISGPSSSSSPTDCCNGGSQTWWAGTPAPASRPTRTSSRLGVPSLGAGWTGTGVGSASGWVV